ncbi:DUF4133 domain-containing protein [Chitinophaga barathri]|uniref:DUF4133 domain-containing protein n=1 Tax=Chitinophaga barathri TaxID=1647451 RepID=A0A3N4MHL8_9BACT|nr:DUF4133 domain-containing protein [Chitinophaga barathri]RPD43098.1 DUF4133 domain-containing protein [Chitinophaga barathri]
MLSPRIKAQYIMYLGLGLVALLILFSILYIAGIPTFICAAVTGVLGYALVTWVIRYSHRYGEHGLIKEIGYRRLPECLHPPGRHIFLSLSKTR